VRVIGVLDLRAGQSVHAVAGDRERYAPVQRVAGATVRPGDACALARSYRDLFGISELYAADLDAIASSAIGSEHGALVAELATIGRTLWLDAGISSPELARRAVDLGATTVIVGLETLPSYRALERICGEVGGSRVAFSLDLRDSVPLTHRDFVEQAAPEDIAAQAAGAGVTAVIVLDVARVGTGAGLNYPLIERVRRVAPDVTLVAGGGIAGRHDLVRLSNAGCDGALVASALHDGRLTPRDVRDALTFEPRRDG
jgi:phosphoribosylformimino-5-aminoimidazole carboxamide ribotide isomerase